MTTIENFFKRQKKPSNERKLEALEDTEDTLKHKQRDALGKENEAVHVHDGQLKDPVKDRHQDQATQQSPCAQGQMDASRQQSKGIIGQQSNGAAPQLVSCSDTPATDLIDLYQGLPQPAKRQTIAASASLARQSHSITAEQHAGQQRQQHQDSLKQQQEQQVPGCAGQTGTAEHNVASMDVDHSPAGGSMGTTQATTRTCSDLVATGEPATPAAAVAIAGNSHADIAVKGSTAKSGQEAFLTAEQRKELLQAYQQELPLLQAEVDVRPNLSKLLAQACEHSKKGQTLDLKHKVSVFVEGQAMPLTHLAQHISTAVSSSSSNGCSSSAPDAPGVAAAATPSATEPAISATVVRNLIQEVASRKSYGLQDGAMANVDALEDASPFYHWCWELHSFTGIPKHIKQHADQARKQRKQVLDRWKAVSAFVQLASSFTKSTKTAEAKLARAAAKLGKLSSLQQLQEQARATAKAQEAARQQSDLAAQAKAAAAHEDKATKQQQAKVEKQQQAEAAKAAKEAERAAKEAEKAAKAAAKAAEVEEKAKSKAEKEAEREEAKQQKLTETVKRKEAAAAARKGFHSAQEMHKTQHAFKSFLVKASQSTPQPAGGSMSASSQVGGSSSQQEVGGQGTCQKQAFRIWALAAGPSKQQLQAMLQLDQQLPYLGGSSKGSHGLPTVAELQAGLQLHWRECRHKHSRLTGLPPSWARRPGIAADLDHIRRVAAHLYGEGVELSRLRCFRRKLIKHYDSVRPPYYGSWSRRSSSVHGRKPLGRDMELDYNNESDQDWEVEPEGESLSKDGDDDDELASDEGDEEEEGGFVVGDGYLSEDEGLQHDEADQTADILIMAPGNTASAGAVPSEAAAPEPVAMAQVEAGLERARLRGKPLLLVNWEGMSWEPTSNLNPSLLSSLKGSILRSDITIAPVTPAELPHLFSSKHLLAGSAATCSVGAAAASLTAAAVQGIPSNGASASAGEAGAAAATGADVAAAAPGSGRRGPTVSVFPAELLPALVQMAHNSTDTMDKLVARFVEAQAAHNVKIAKARVKDKVKEITTMRMAAKAPLYTVKPQYLQAIAESVTAAAGTKQDGSVEAMQVEEPSEQVQQSMVALLAAATTPAAATGSVAGVKRIAPAADARADASTDPVTTAIGHETSAANASTAGHTQQTSPATAASELAAAGPAHKKQKTPATSGLHRFFGVAKPAKPEQRQSPVQQPVLQLSTHQQSKQSEQQLQTLLETPPSTPRATSTAAAASGTAQAAANASCTGIGSKWCGGVVNNNVALPLLTPASDLPVDRPGKANSPVPFCMNAAIAHSDGHNSNQVKAAPAAVNRAPVNRWHAQADCRGLGLQGGDAASMPVKQQQAQLEQQVGQQQQGAVSSPAVPGGTASAASPSAAAPGGICRGGGPNRGVPQLQLDGALPGSAFWRELASWIVSAREPPAADITTAFAVFDEQHLVGCIHMMPQVVLSAMVKTLGSSSQSLAMRAACARCIANTAACLAKVRAPAQELHGVASAPAGSIASTSSIPSQQQQQQQQPGQAGSSNTTAEAAAEASPCLATKSIATGSAATAGAPVSTMPPNKKRSRSFTPSPSPNGSPRSAPVSVSFEELAAEPGLLPNLLLCMNPEKALDAAEKAAAAAAPPRDADGAEHVAAVGSHAGAAALARNAARAVATLLMVGVRNPIATQGGWCADAAAASEHLRLHVASTAAWRGVLKKAIAQPGCRFRTTCSLMAVHALLSHTAASSQLMSNSRLAKQMLGAITQRGAASTEWAVQKWCLLVISALLGHDTLRDLALPQTPLAALAVGNEEVMTILVQLATLLAACINRPQVNLSVPGPDRTILHKSLQLVHLLFSYVGSQQQLNNGRLPPRLAVLVSDDARGDKNQDAGNCSLAQALKEVVLQDEWEEAAVQARQMLESLTAGSTNTHMTDT